MKPFGKILLLFVVVLIWLIGFALLRPQMGERVRFFRAMDMSGLESYLSFSGLRDSSRSIVADIHVSPGDEEESKNSANVVMPDTLKREVPPSAPVRIVKADSTKFRILFFGDSMLEGLAPRLCEYANESDIDLTSVIWYGSSTQLWAQTDTLEYFMKGVNPDYVMLCLGSNELFVRNLDDRDEYIASIVKKLGKTPFVWISPPNWKDDTGINDLIIKHVGLGRYFDSRNLVMDRLSDKAHPTHEAAITWMDTIVSWLGTSASSHPLSLPTPTEKRPHKFRQYMLKPVE